MQAPSPYPENCINGKVLLRIDDYDRSTYNFLLKKHNPLCARKFNLWLDIQALSWLKTYTIDQAVIERWTMAIEKKVKLGHRLPAQHRMANRPKQPHKSRRERKETT